MSEVQNTPGSLSPGVATLASSPATTGQEQSTPGTQTPAKDSTPAQPNAGQPGSQDLGGFKSADELKKAYDELRAWNTRLAQEVSQVKSKLSLQPAQQPAQQVTPQDILNQFVQAPDQVLESVRNDAVNEAMSRVSTTLTLAKVIEEARAVNPDVVTSENEDFLATLAKKAEIPEGTDPLAAARMRMDYAVKSYRAFVTKIKESGMKAGEAAAAMKAQAGFETGSVSINSNPGLNKDAVLKLLQDNPTEYKRLWKEKPNEMIAAFNS